MLKKLIYTDIPIQWTIPNVLLECKLLYLVNYYVKYSINKSNNQNINKQVQNN